MNIKLLVGLLLLKIGEHIGQIVLLLGLITLSVFTMLFLFVGITKATLIGATIGVVITAIGSRLMN